MAESALKVAGGPSTSIVPTTAAKTATLTFAKPDELAIYEALVLMAEDRDYSLSKFIVRILIGKESLPVDNHGE